MSGVEESDEALMEKVLNECATSETHVDVDTMASKQEETLMGQIMMESDPETGKHGHRTEESNQLVREEVYSRRVENTVKSLFAWAPKAYIDTEKENRINFAYIVSKLPAYDPATIALGFEENLVDNTKSKSIWFTKTMVRQWCAQNMGQYFFTVPVGGLNRISCLPTHGLWGLLPLPNIQHWPRGRRGRAKICRDLIVGNTEYIFTDTKLHMYMGLLSFLFAFSTGIGSRLGAASMKWYIFHTFTLVASYCTLRGMAYVANAIDVTLSAPVIPIPDFLVVKLFPNRVELYCLVWKEVFYYEGRDSIGMKFVSSDFAPFKPRNDMKRFLYIFLKSKDGIKCDSVALETFRLSFHAALNRLVRRIHCLQRGYFGRVKALHEPESMLENHLEIWRLGIHKKGDNLNNPFRLKRHVDLISKAFFVTQVNAIQNKNIENTILEYTTNLLTRLAYVAVGWSHANKYVRGRTDLDPPTIYKRPKKVHVLLDKPAVVKHMSDLVLWEELCPLLNIPKTLFGEMRALFQQELPNVAITTVSKYVTRLRLAAKHSMAAREENDEFEECINSLVEAILNAKNKRIEEMMQTIFCPDFTAALGDLSKSCVAQCVSVTAMKWFAGEFSALREQFRLHLVSTRGEVDMEVLSRFFDTVGAQKPAAKRIVDGSDGAAACDNVVLAYFVDYATKNSDSIPSPNDTIPVLQHGNSTLYSCDGAGDSSATKWHAAVFHVHIYWQCVGLLIMPLLPNYSSGFAVPSLLSSCFFFVDLGTVTYAGAKLWAAIVLAAVLLFQLVRVVEKVLYDKHPEWLSTAGFILRAYAQRALHNLNMRIKVEKRLHQMHDKATMRRLRKQSQWRRDLANTVIKYQQERDRLHLKLLRILEHWSGKMCYGIEKASEKEQATDTILEDVHDTKQLSNTLLLCDLFLVPIMVTLETSMRCNSCNFWMGLTITCGAPLHTTVAVLSRLVLSLVFIAAATIIPLWFFVLRLHEFVYNRISIARNKGQLGSRRAMYESEMSHFSLMSHSSEFLLRYALCISSVGLGISSPGHATRINLAILLLHLCFVVCKDLNVCCCVQRRRLWVTMRFVAYLMLCTVAVVSYEFVQHRSTNEIRSHSAYQNTTANVTTIETDDMASPTGSRRRRHLLRRPSPCDVNTSLTPLSSVNCDFEGNSMCRWQSYGGATNWTINEGETETRGTGPLFADYGLGLIESVKYLYIKSDLYFLNWGDKAYVYSPWFTLSSAQDDTCYFDLSFHMRGGSNPVTGMGSMLVDQRNISCNATNGFGGESWVRIFESHGNKGFEWNRTSLRLLKNKTPLPTQLRITGIIHGSTSDMAIDTLVVRCQGLPEIVPPQPPFVPPDSCWKTAEHPLSAGIAAGGILCIIVLHWLYHLMRALKHGSHVRPPGSGGNWRTMFYCCKQRRTMLGKINLNGLRSSAHPLPSAPPLAPWNRPCHPYSELGVATDSNPVQIDILKIVQKRLRFRQEQIVRIAIWLPLNTKRTDILWKGKRVLYKRADVCILNARHFTRRPTWVSTNRCDLLPTFRFSSIYDVENAYVYVSFVGSAGCVQPNCGRVENSPSFRFSLSQAGDGLRNCYESRKNIAALPLPTNGKYDLLRALSDNKTHTLHRSFRTGDGASMDVRVSCISPAAHVVGKILDIPCGKVYNSSIVSIQQSLGFPAMHHVLNFSVDAYSTGALKRLYGSIRFAENNKIIEHVCKVHLDLSVGNVEIETKEHPLSCRTCCHDTGRWLGRAWHGLRLKLSKWYILGSLVGVGIALSAHIKETARALYICCFEKTEKVVEVEWEESGESPTKAKIGMRVSVRHKFTDHEHYRKLYQWRNATIVGKHCTGKQVKIAYDREKYPRSPTKWVRLDPEEIKWRKNVKNEFGSIQMPKYAVAARNIASEATQV
jgi:hypothetical protein